MTSIQILTPAASVCILRPHPAESDDGFRRRMQAMIAVLSEHAPDAVAVLLDDTERPLVCVVTRSLRPRPEGQAPGAPAEPPLR